MNGTKIKYVWGIMRGPFSHGGIHVHFDISLFIEISRLIQFPTHSSAVSTGLVLPSPHCLLAANFNMRQKREKGPLERRLRRSKKHRIKTLFFFFLIFAQEKLNLNPLVAETVSKKSPHTPKTCPAAKTAQLSLSH